MMASSSSSSSSAALDLLVSCAQAIQVGNLKSADSLLHQIWNLAAQESDKNQSKVVKYFAEALVRRAYGLHPTGAYSLVQITPPLSDFYLWNDSINEMVGDAINNTVMGKKRLHLIDFGIPHYGWNRFLFKTPSNRSGDLLPVRISVILPPFLKNTVNVEEEMHYLTEEAKLFKVKLEVKFKVVYANSLGEVDASILDFKRTDDEAVVVCYTFELHKFLVKPEAMKKELIKLRQINPEIVIMQEHYANHNHNDSNFIKRLQDSFQYYSDVYNVQEYNMQDINKYYKRQINNIVGCEGNSRIIRHQTLADWRDLLLTNGFLQVQIQLKDFSNKYLIYWKGMIHEEKGCLVIGHKDRPMFFVSAWKLKVGENFNFNPNGNKFGLGFDPSPLSDNIIQPFQPFPEGFSLNRLAAFAEIYDTLEEVCFKYELPLALTWACEPNVNEITIDPYKKRSLVIQSTSCFADNDSKIYYFDMKASEKLYLQEGQAIGGKALQSSDDYHFEPSITKLNKHDHPLISVAQLFGIHGAVAICLQNHYTINDVYVVEFYWPATHSEKSESLALDIFNDLKNMKKKFVTLRNRGAEVGFEEEAISNTPASSTNDFLNSKTTWSLNTVEPWDVHAMEIQGLNEQGGVVRNELSPAFKAPNPMSYKGVVQTQGPHEQEIGEKNIISQTISTDDREIVGANKETHARRQTKQRKLSSKVWEDFDKFGVNGKQVAKCKHCHNEFTGSSKSGTTHLKNHLERCRSKKIKNQERQLTFPAEMGHLTSRDTDERNSMFDQERSRLDFAKMIIKHQYPLDMAEQEFFKNFVKNLQPMFEFQSQAIILSDIHRIYEEEKEKLQRYFNQLACNFSLTISLWKDNLGKKAYCCLIAHFIDDDWELKMKILAFKTLEHIYDTGTLSGIIRSSLLEWNMGKKVCSITVDNSSLNDDMVQQIKENCLGDQGSLPSSHWFISCTLIEDGFHEMDDILLKLRKSIEYVSETTHGKLKFQEIVNQVKLQGGKSGDDLSLRLDSNFGILDSALDSRAIFCQLEQIDCNFKVNPSMEEWEKALAMRSCLKGFDDILISLKGTQSLTANLYFPKLCNIYKKFLQLEKSNYPFVTLMKRKFDYYWSLCNLAFAVAAVLDPRLKFKFVEFSYNEIYGHDSKMQLNRFHKVLTDVYYEYANEARNLTPSASAFGDLSCSTTQIANDCILDSFSKFASASNFNEVASWKSELDCYLDEPLLPLDGAFFDILGWWRVNSERFPTLGKMARDLLAMPVSIFPQCSDFSAMITNPANSSLNPESMEALVCSQNWLEIPKGNNRANHEPLQNTAKSKRKMDEKETSVVKISRNRNSEEANSVRDNAKDSNKNVEIPDGNPSFDNWLVLQYSSSKTVGEKAESMEASVCNQNRLEMSKGYDKANHAPMQNSVGTYEAKRKMEEKEIHAVKSLKNWNYGETSDVDKSKASFKMNVQQERGLLKSSEPNHGRHIGGSIEIPNDDPSFDKNQSEFLCSSSESDDETTWREQGAWCKEDVRAYLVSSFTDKENKRLNRLWQNREMSGKLIGRNKEFGVVYNKLAPLLFPPHGNETRVAYYVDDLVVNTFFKLLKKRSDRFPKAYINHYSFDSGIATYLIKGSRSEDEVLDWFKAEKLIGVHKLFLPLCLSAHWVLFYVDTKEKKFSWLDSNPSSRMSNNVEKLTILRWFISFLLPVFGYNNANEWPFVVRTDIPEQKNLVDCGIFVMKYADCLTHGDFFPFTQEDMPHFRLRTFLDIYRGRLHSQK